MRAAVEAIRGVQCGDILHMLMEKGLTRIAGRHESLGRPVLYGTTKKFLQLFGLKSLEDLPEIEQFGQLSN
jgi:segregation and condensation protein B